MSSDSDKDPELKDRQAQELDPRQQSLADKLALLPEGGSEFAVMYRGAVVALASGNPDAAAQAAHSARELMEKLVRSTSAEHESAGAVRIQDRVEEMIEQWRRYKAGHGEPPAVDDGVTPELRLVLERVELVEQARPAHRRVLRERAEIAMPELGLVDPGLPEALQKEDAGAWVKLHGFFQRASHHKRELCTVERVDSKLRELEDLLFRLVPNTFDDLKALDVLLEEAANAD